MANGPLLLNKDVGGPGLFASPTLQPRSPYLTTDRTCGKNRDHSQLRLGEIATPMKWGPVANLSPLAPPN